VAWKDVGATTGTGIVHIAPGCGKEDFQLGKEVGLPPIAPLDDAGVFLAGFGALEGRSAVDPATAEFILDNLREKGRLFASEVYPHSYPHCWRCKTELLFRLVDEWFINMSWRGEIMDVTRQVTFLPESISGQTRELKWLEQMRDWMISKKRFWGLALPIWVCESCGQSDVVGGREELRQRAIEGWERFEGHSPHRPWVDLVKIKCSHCGGLASRIPDVGNPWLDAGIVPYSTLGYNHDRQFWEKWFPADFITESFPGQFRNWFYAILAMSTMMEHRPPFQVLLGHALVHDQRGDIMAKTKGNAIEFNGAANDGYELFCEREPKLSVEQQAKRDLPAGWTACAEGEVVFEGRRLTVVKGKYPPIGADVIRWLYCRSNPAVNINFGPGPADELRAKFHIKLWNSYAFFCNYAALDGFDPAAPQVPVRDRPDIDRWILSDLQQLVQAARQEFEAFDVMAFCLAVEEFVDAKLSNWYIRRNRKRFWKSEAGADKLAAYQTLYTVLTTLVKLIAPVVPFLSEAMWRNLRTAAEPESVHLCDYPDADPKLIDEELSGDMDALLRLVSLGSAARNSVKIKVRQPLAEMRVQPANDLERRAVERFADQIREELNVKKVTLHDPARGPLLRLEAKPNMKTLGPKFGPRLKAVTAALAAADPAAVAARVAAGEAVTLTCADGPATLDPADVVMATKAPEGWAGVDDRGTQVLIDTRITEALAREGMAREVVRHVQNARREAGLEVEDRIVLYLHTESATLRQAIEAHKAYIMTETLATQWATQPLGDKAYRVNVKVDGQPLTIELRKIPAGS
jgi:isoleucyl-tRNA synthetase